MNKRILKGAALLITYTVLLVALLLKLDVVLSWGEAVLSALQPLFVGFAIAFVLHRPCVFFAKVFRRLFSGRLEKLALPLAVVSSYLVLAAVIGLLVSLVVPELAGSIRTFIGNLSLYTANLQGLLSRLNGLLNLEFLYTLDLSGFIQNTLRSLLSGMLEALTATVPQLITMTGALVSFVVTFVLSLVFSIYMLADSGRLLGHCSRTLQAYLPEKVFKKFQEVASLSADIFTKFISGQVTEACILGLLCFAGMVIFRFEYAPLISVIIGVSALVPIAGAYVGAVLAVLLLVMINPMQAVWFFVFLLVLQQLEGNLIYPRVVGGSIGLPGIWVLTAVTVGGGLFGFIGMLVSVPITAIGYTLLRDDVRRRERDTDASDKGE